MMDPLAVIKADKIYSSGMKLFERLFGKSIDEYGGLLQDKIVLRRFKNQFKILSDAQEFLKKNGFNAKEISLKILVPLIEYSSLEEEPILQKKWSALIANISTNKDQDIFVKNYIETLNRMSSTEVKILDSLFDSILVANQLSNMETNNSFNEQIDFIVEETKFSKQQLFEQINISENDLSYCLDNLIIHGILKLDLPNIKE